MPGSVKRYEFGPFVVDVTRRTLLRDGTAVPLAPKAFELLLALIERPRRVVSKRELLERVWPDTFVEDANIAQNVSLLRKALQDGDDGERLVITVPRVGYQFTGVVRAVPLDGDGARPSTGGFVRSLAVVPFAPLAGADMGNTIGTAFADAVASAVRTLPVHVQTVPHDGGNAAGIANAVGADAYLLGYYQCSGGSLWNLAVQLIRTGDAALLWATSIRGEFTTVNDARDAVSAEVLTSLRAVLIQSQPAATQLQREVFRLYLRGRYAWNKRTAEGLKIAFQCAMEAIETDPACARGYVGIADTYNLLGGMQGALAPHEAFPRARSAARRALEINDARGEAHASLAFVACWYDWNLEEGERHFRRAAELKPTYATTYHWWGEALACAGRFAESMTMFETALALDPLSSAIRADFAHALSLAGEHARCETTISEVLKFDPDFARAVIVQALHGERRGDLRRAHELALRAMEMEHSSMALALVARSAAALGSRDEAQARLEQLEGASGNVVNAEVATVYAALGRYDAAQRHLEQSLEKREPHFLWLIQEPAFDALRAHTGLLELWASLRTNKN